MPGFKKKGHSLPLAEKKGHRGKPEEGGYRTTEVRHRRKRGKSQLKATRTAWVLHHEGRDMRQKRRATLTQAGGGLKSGHVERKRGKISLTPTRKEKSPSPILCRIRRQGHVATEGREEK